ncbi:SLAP domain-containing protein [Solibacillus sp. FSL K6-1523]|uniref:SLAP domain-containing protein n=1 Tax=Solibacillus sp. FSL K6-1523 TaxID=2921471 RepID=UPI0030F8CE96
MQKLLFEATWDKALSGTDRELIKQIFNKHTVQLDTVSCYLIRSARNHHNHFLVTVLIHNETAIEQIFIERDVSLQMEYGQYTQKFTQPKLVIPSHISMPWTFIFEHVAQNTGEVLTITIH